MAGRPMSVLARYGAALALVVVAQGVRWLIPETVEPMLWFLPFVVAVGVAAWLGGFGPGLLATAEAAWLSSGILLDPGRSLEFAGAGETFGWVLFLGLCLLVGIFCSANRSPWQPF